MNTLLDRVPLWIAVVPLGLYFLWLAAAHCRRHPLVVSGVGDGVGLGLGLVGLVMAALKVMKNNHNHLEMLLSLFICCITRDNREDKHKTIIDFD